MARQRRRQAEDAGPLASVELQLTSPRAQRPVALAGGQHLTGPAREEAMSNARSGVLRSPGGLPNGLDASQLNSPQRSCSRCVERLLRGRLMYDTGTRL